MTQIKKIKKHLIDNAGDENITKMIWIVIVFVVGGLLFTLMTGVHDTVIGPWLEARFDSWFNDNNSGFPEQ